MQQRWHLDQYEGYVCQQIIDTKRTSQISLLVKFGSILWNLMHYNFSHFDPYHAVQLKSLAEQYTLCDQQLEGQQWIEDCLCRMSVCCDSWGFLFDVFIHYCKKITLKSDSEIKITAAASF